MRRLLLAVVLITWFLAAPLPVCAQDARRPNVLVLVADDMRPDAVSGLGHKQVRTPSLDALIRRGIVLRRATCANPICVPSRAEMLSGRTSFKNGFYPTGWLAKDGPPVLAEWLRRAGFRAFYVGKWHTSGRPSTRGYDEAVGLYAGGIRPDQPQFDHAGRKVTGYAGWMFQTDAGKKFPERGVGLTPNISADFAETAIEVIRRPHRQPFFLHVNFTAPHDPRLVPPGFADKYPAAKIELPKNFRAEHPFDHGNMKGRDEVLLDYPRRPEEVRAELAVYYAVIEHMDREIGRILAALDDTGLADETIVIFTSDHGLALGSHGLVGKQNMYWHTLNVPLIFRGPGIPQGQRRDALCYLRDLYPTIAELVGAEAPKHVDGRSLVPVLRGQRDEVYPFITGYFADKQRSLVQGRWQYIVYPAAGRQQLFDLDADPDQLHDLSAAPEHAERVRELRRLLRGWLAEQGDKLADGL
jgi:arylsulfatase A-like enzyme